MQDEAAMSFRLSPQQELAWSARPDGPTGGAQAVLELIGDLDADRLHAALGHVVDRHEILRTTFRHRPGMKTPLQVVHPTLAPEWADAGQADGAAVAKVAADESSRAWDYENGPLVHAVLAGLAGDRHALVLTIAPPCADAGSISVIIGELVSAYAGATPEDDPLQYADFAEWQQQLLSGEDDDASAGRAFWADAAPTTSTALPFLQTVPAAASEEFEVDLASVTLESIGAMSEKYGVAPESIVQAALHVTVARLAAEDEVTLAFVPSTRLHEELTRAVGAFARPLPITSRPRGMSFAELAVAVQHAAELAQRWQDTAPPDAAGAAVGFVAVERPAAVDGNGVSFVCDRLAGAPAFPVELEWDGVGCRLRVEPAAFDRVSAERTARYIGRVLAAAAGAPETIVDELEMLDESDVHRLTVEVNRTGTELPSATAAEMVAAVAAASPERVAVVDEAGALTYAELERRANGLAHRLRRSGVRDGSVVGLCTDRSTGMIVGLLGILKAGAAYLPLNFEHPPARLAHQIVETKAVAVVTQEPLLDRLPEFDGEVVCIDRDRAELDREPETAPEGHASPDDLAYVIYTSGSTGTPKGVGVTNANVSNYVQAIGRQLGADEEPRTFAMVSAISTDLGNTAVFPALCLGGTLLLVSPAAAADGAVASAFLQANHADVLKITPSHLGALLVGADAAGVLPKRWLVVGGEALSWNLVARVRELGECRILNHFGPTETTIGSCTFALDDGGSEPATATVPIGSPIANTSCYVLDEHGRCVAEGIPGELFIAGAGVARGYIGRPDLTDERFRPNPYGDGRMYATGDLVRRLPDGTLEFLGRRDDQIKIRGFRVEPAEIEGALHAFDPVREAAVVPLPDSRGERRLVAYVTLSSRANVEQLRGHLTELLPDYMIPSAFVVLDSLPLTPSGKIDRLSLPDPDSMNGAGAAAYIAPRTPVEESVAAIWTDILGVERVGVEDDFFVLGGHSLLATQIVAQVRSDFSINLPLHALFTSPTVASLARQIVELLGQAPDADTERLLSELEGLSDEEVALLLAAEAPPETQAQ